MSQIAEEPKDTKAELQSTVVALRMAMEELREMAQPIRQMLPGDRRLLRLADNADNEADLIAVVLI